MTTLFAEVIEAVASTFCLGVFPMSSSKRRQEEPDVPAVSPPQAPRREEGEGG